MTPKSWQIREEYVARMVGDQKTPGLATLRLAAGQQYDIDQLQQRAERAERAADVLRRLTFAAAEELIELRARVAALEEASACNLSYEGIHESGKAYRRNVAVTYGGSLFISERETSARPGTPDSGWRLAVKKGRDAR